jgi:hypothetical protein
MLGLGTYRLQITSCAEGWNPGKRRESYKVTARVVEAEGETAVGATCTIVHFINPAGLGELKRLVMHAAGFGLSLEARATCANLRQSLIEAEAAFDALDESFGGGTQGSVIEASAGKANGAPSIVGRLVDCIVQRGKDVPNPQTGAPTGDYFRVYTWGVVESQ